MSRSMTQSAPSIASAPSPPRRAPTRRVDSHRSRGGRCGSTIGSSTIFTTVCATRSATVGMPSGRVPPSVLRYLDEPHGRRKVRARRHPIPDLVEVALQVLLECRQRLAIHARSTSVRLHPLVRFPDELLRNLIRLCLRHRLLPLLVDRSPRPESRAPSLRPHYQASSLLRARPPLRLASVLCSSWVLHLEVSLGIEAQVPTFRTRACAGLTPSSCRSPLGQSAGILPSFVPGQRLEPGFDDVPTLSTRHQRFTRVRLPSSTPDGFSPAFSATLTTPAIGPAQLPVVWTLTLQSESEGPALISCAARLLRVGLT